jgi:hypothetical protein
MGRVISLEDIRDSRGRKVKVGDSVRFTLLNGMENVIREVEECNGKIKPIALAYLEFEVLEQS